MFKEKQPVPPKEEERIGGFATKFRHQDGVIIDNRYWLVRGDKPGSPQLRVRVFDIQEGELKRSVLIEPNTSYSLEPEVPGARIVIRRPYGRNAQIHVVASPDTFVVREENFVPNYLEDL